MKALKYRLANANDIETLVVLINQAYRTNTGRSWTNEQHIVIGDRINAQQLKQTLAQENFCLFIAEMVEDLESVLVSCIGLTFLQNSVEIGTFCVASAWQNQGIGKQMLAHAERKALEIFPAFQQYEMYVLHVRTELIQYYERCGYSKTACVESYPIGANVGQPLIDLQLQQMSKPVLKLG